MKEMPGEFYNKPLTGYQSTSPYQIPVPEEHHWKNDYMRVDFENKSFNYLRIKFERLDIPTEKIEDLVEELMLIINNAGKMKIEIAMIETFTDEFEQVWESFKIYILKNSRWVDELEHLRHYAKMVFQQELFKSIGGWQGDNILTYRSEQKQAYALKQETVSSGEKRGWFRNKKKKAAGPAPAMQGYNISGQGYGQR